MKENLIEVNQLSFCYGSETVLEDVTFSIQAGEYVGIIGPNGSGKTTLLKILLGLLTPTQGSVRLFGESMQLGRHSAEIGYIPQKITQTETRFPITVREVVKLGRVNKKSLFKRFSNLDEEKISKALKIVGMEAQQDRLISDLSGGQQQRVFIAKALACEPKILILDEPTVGIDVESQEEFYALLARLNKKNKVTIVLVSHDVDVVANEVSSVLCVNKSVVYHGNPKTFLEADYLEKLYGKNRKYIIHGH